MVNCFLCGIDKRLGIDLIRHGCFRRIVFESNFVGLVTAVTNAALAHCAQGLGILAMSTNLGWSWSTTRRRGAM